MRSLELAIVVIALAYVIYVLSSSREYYFWFKLLPFLMLPLIAGHVLVEGARWQMLPIYVLLPIFASYEIARWVADIRAPYLAGFAALCCLFLAVGLSTVWPVFQLPRPTGIYAIGTRILHIVDVNRREPNDPQRARELMIQIWYPADPEGRGELAPYRERSSTTAWDARLALVMTHAVREAPLARSDNRYPVVLYAPSWDGLRGENTFQAEELASHGYIVVGVDHPYSSAITTFPDGRTVRTKLVDTDFYSSEGAVEQFFRTAESEIRLRAEDLRFVLESLRTLDAADSEGTFAGRFDFERVGVFGFSLGGGVAAQAAWLEPGMIKAVVNLDGMMAAESLIEGCDARTFFIGESDPVSPDKMPRLSPSKQREADLNWLQFVQMRSLIARREGYWLAVAGARHANFSDVPLSSPLLVGFRSAFRNPTTVANLVTRYMLAFFDRELKGIEQPQLRDDAEHAPEVRFEHLRLSG